VTRSPNESGSTTCPLAACPTSAIHFVGQRRISSLYSSPRATERPRRVPEPRFRLAEIGEIVHRRPQCTGPPRSAPISAACPSTRICKIAAFSGSTRSFRRAFHRPTISCRKPKRSAGFGVVQFLRSQRLRIRRHGQRFSFKHAIGHDGQKRRVNSAEYATITLRSRAKCFRDRRGLRAASGVGTWESHEFVRGAVRPACTFLKHAGGRPHHNFTR